MALVLFFLIVSPAFSKAPAQADFLSLCKEMAKSRQQQLACEKLDQIFFVGQGQGAHPLPIKALGISELPIDPQLQLWVFRDPNKFTAMGYCYFLFRGWMKMEDLVPDTFSTIVNGVTLINEQIEEFKNWSKNTLAGNRCQKLLEKETQETMPDLWQLMGNKKGIIAVNPYALIKEKGINERIILNELKLILNHERVHAIQSTCPSFQTWSKNQWTALSKNLRADMAKLHPAYNWNDPTVAGREYVAYALENDISAIATQTKACK